MGEYQNYCHEHGHGACILMHREQSPWWVPWWLQVLVGGVCACEAGNGFHR
jgi:hypothetical protein